MSAVRRGAIQREDLRCDLDIGCFSGPNLRRQIDKWYHKLGVARLRRRSDRLQAEAAKVKERAERAARTAEQQVRNSGNHATSCPSVPRPLAQSPNRAARRAAARAS